MAVAGGMNGLTNFDAFAGSAVATSSPRHYMHAKPGIAMPMDAVGPMVWFLSS